MKYKRFCIIGIVIINILLVVNILTWTKVISGWKWKANDQSSYIVIDGLVSETVINANSLTTEDRRAIIDAKEYGIFLTSNGITELRDHNGECQFAGLHQVKVGDKAYAFGKVFVCKKIELHKVNTETWTSEVNAIDFAYYDLLMETCANADGSIQLFTYWKIEE